MTVLIIRSTEMELFKTLFKPEKFEKASFSKTILKMEIFENSSRIRSNLNKSRGCLTTPPATCAPFPDCLFYEPRFISRYAYDIK